MSVTATESAINLSDRAAQEIKGLFEQQGIDNAALRGLEKRGFIELSRAAAAPASSTAWPSRTR